MSQHLSDQNLIAYVTRTLTDVQRAEIDRHVTECERCRTQLEHHAALQRRIRNSVIAQRKSGPSRHATFAQIAPQVKQSRARVRVLQRPKQFFSNTLILAALLALVILLIGVFSSARQAAVERHAILTDVPVSKVPLTSTPPARLIAEFGGGETDPLSSPTGLALDPQGNLYIADTGNNRILKYDPNGRRLTQWGSYGSGDGQFIFGATTNSLLNGDLAVDGQSNVYVDDTANARIQKFDGNGKFLLKWGIAGVGEGQFGHITGIAVDNQGNVYTTEDDPFPRVQKFDSNGRYLLQWKTLPSDNGSSFRPNDIAIDAQGLIYLIDFSTESIQTFDRTGKFISNWKPICGSRDVITALSSIAFDSSNNLYLADNVSGRICKFDRNGRFLTQWSDSFGLVQGIAVDALGNVYVANADPSRIQKFQLP